MNMTHEEVANLFRRYEEKHAVDRYEVHGIHVWPLLRTVVATRLIQSRTPAHSVAPFESKVANLLYRSFWWLGLSSFRRTRNYYRKIAARLPPALRRKNQWDIPDGGYSAAIVTNTERTLWLGDLWLHFVVDPLASLLDESNLSSFIWESGTGPNPRLHQPHSLAGLHKHEYNIASSKLPNTLPRPRWFTEFEEYMMRDHSVRVAWREFGSTIRHILVLAQVFEKWMRAAQCRIVFLDCWYTAHSFAATLAAKRLGIPSVDFQHGLQGELNAMYTSWTKFPPGGYGIMPTHFWVWGEDEADYLVKDNVSTIADRSNIIVGGNLWINKWRSGDDPRIKQYNRSVDALVKGFSKVVLLTLQYPSHTYPKWILDSIRDSPPDWRWFVRIHRRHMRNRSGIMKQFTSTGHPGVECEQATNLPLYSLLAHCDVHITGFSTCAVEAMAFGVPTILTHPAGDRLYNRYIAAGVMTRCDNAAGVLEYINQEIYCSSENMNRSTERAFASIESSYRAIDRIKKMCFGNEDSL